MRYLNGLRWTGWGCVVLLSAVTAALGAGAATQPSADASAAAEHPLRVGVLVSTYTATGPSAMGRPYGYDHASIADKLADPSVQLIPLIEPDSEADEDLAKVIAEKFPQANEQVLNAGDVDSLKSLDAIVVSRTPNMKDEVIEAMTKAVESGTGLLVVGPVGVLNPGMKSKAMKKLLGLKEGQYGFAPDAQNAEAIAKDDPLLKDLTEPEKWTCMPNGVSGNFMQKVKPLVKLESPGNVRIVFNKLDSEVDFYLVYQLPLGKGSVIVCNWSANGPGVVDDKPTFYIRCIRRMVEVRKK